MGCRDIYQTTLGLQIKMKAKKILENNKSKANRFCDKTVQIAYFRVNPNSTNCLLTLTVQIASFYT